MAENWLTRQVMRAVEWVGPNRAAIDDDPEVITPNTGELVSRDPTFSTGWDVPTLYLGMIAQNDDKILQRGGGLGLELYEDLLDDDVAFSTWQQRRLRVISRPWEVSPGDPKDPRSVEAADHLREQLNSLPFDRITDRMLYGIWFGYAVAEGIYEIGSDGKYKLSDIVVPDRKWFGFTRGGELRFKPNILISNEVLPPNKFWVLRTGASHDFAFYGLGLAHWCYWPIWFKRNVIRFWALFLEKMGYPTVLGEQLDTWTKAEKDDFLKALGAIGRDRAVRVAAGAAANIKLMESTRANAGSSGFNDFISEQNDALMRVVVGQPGTSKATAQGIGGTQADVHEDIAAMIGKADSDLVCESFNATFPVWLTRMNFGPDVKPPRVYRVMDEPDDLDAIANRDATLDGIGIKRTKESVEEVYGPGYELKEPEPVPPALVPGQLPAPAAANDDPAADDRRTAFSAQDIAPLYIYRQLRKPAKLAAFIKAAGIPQPTEDADLHVTVLYSKTPVDWFEMSNDWGFNGELTVGEGGARKIERFDSGAIVLRFASPDLKWSHESKVERGASHDYAEYSPHVTLGYDPTGTFDIDAIEPFVGELVFGPEMFEEIETPTIDTALFAAAEEDAIDRVAAMLADETSPLFLEFGAVLQSALEGIESPEAARVALLEAFERMPADRMAQIAGLPLVLERMAGEAGIDE